MEDYNKIIHSLVNLNRGELAIFCGAGISKNSGLPLAGELRNYILEQLIEDSHEVDLLIKKIEEVGLPFEAFMETILKHRDDLSLLGLFKEGNPNSNHLLIAELAKNRIVKTILTTNFDSMIERAFEKEGLVRDKDYKVLYKEDDFTQENLDDVKDNRIILCKIHGRVENDEDMRSIRTTLTHVALRSWSEKRFNAIKLLCLNGRHNKVLVLGYSCSDVFDITPLIESISNSRKEIFLLDHSIHVTRIREISLKDQPNPFRRFQGKWIECDTDNFVADLWIACSGSHKQFKEYIELKRMAEKWKKYVNLWNEQLSRGQRAFLLGEIYFFLSMYDKAIECYQKASSTAAKENNSLGYGNSLNRMAYIYINKNEFDQALEYYNKALVPFSMIQYAQGEAKCYHGVGVVNQLKGNYDEAIKFHHKALRLFKEFGDAMEVCGSLGQLGYTYQLKGKYIDALQYYGEALRISEQFGDIRGIGVAHINIAQVFQLQGDHNSALDHYKKTLEVKKKLGDEHGAGKTLFQIATISGDIELLNEAIKIFEKIGDIKGLGDCYHLIGSICFLNGIDDESLKYYEKSLKISEEIGDKKGVGTSYACIGNIHGVNGDYDSALNYYNRALNST